MDELDMSKLPKHWMIKIIYLKILNLLHWFNSFSGGRVNISKSSVKATYNFRHVPIRSQCGRWWNPMCPGTLRHFPKYLLNWFTKAVSSLIFIIRRIQIDLKVSRALYLLSPFCHPDDQAEKAPEKNLRPSPVMTLSIFFFVQQAVFF